MTIYGQEKDNATWALSKMNMILHGNEIAEIEKGDTITARSSPTAIGCATFDYAVANPPFSVKSWNNGLENDYGRFEFGRPPGEERRLRLPAAHHSSHSRAPARRGHPSSRRALPWQRRGDHPHPLIKRGYIKGIIGLPANLFYGTGIPACIVVLDKENAQARTGIFMIDASKGFEKDGQEPPS
jgi:type I restriction enzyme M protein